jgi:hypothetical protein
MIEEPAGRTITQDEYTSLYIKMRHYRLDLFGTNVILFGTNVKLWPYFYRYLNSFEALLELPYESFPFSPLSYIIMEPYAELQPIPPYTDTVKR